MGSGNLPQFLTAEASPTKSAEDIPDFLKKKLKEDGLFSTFSKAAKLLSQTGTTLGNGKVQSKNGLTPTGETVDGIPTVSLDEEKKVEKNNEPLGFGAKAKQSVMSGIFHPDVSIDHEDPAKSILSSYDRDIEEAKSASPKGATKYIDIITQHKQLSGLEKEKKETEQSLINTDAGARNWLFREGKTINPLNQTDMLALQTHMKRKAWDIADEQAGTFDEAVVLMTGGKKEDIPEATMGAIVDNALHSPLVIEKANENADFHNKYYQAKNDLYKNYPSYAFKKVSEMIGQKLEDEKMTGWLYANPSLKKVEKAIDMLKEDGVWGDQEEEIFKQKFLPYIAVGAADKVITLTDAAHQFGYGVYEGAKGFDASGRDIINKLSGGFIDPEGNGLFQNMGLMEKNQDRTEGLAQEAAATPIVTPTRDFTKVFAPAANFTGTFAPMIIGSAVRIPHVLNTTLMFEGHNADHARELFKGNVGKQNLYTLAATSFDVFALKALPTKKAADGFKRLIDKDIRKAITDLSDKKITEDVIQKNLWEKAFEYTKTIAGHNTKTAAILEGYNLGHKGIDAAFGVRDFNVENELQEAISNYPTNWLNSTFLSGLAAAKGNAQPISGKMYKKIADNPEFYRDIINKDNQLSPIEKQDRLEKIDQLEAVNSMLSKGDYKTKQVEDYLNTSMQQFVAEKAVKEAADKVLAKEDAKKVEIAEIEKEHIITPMTNTQLLETFYKKELLPKDAIKSLSDTETGKKFDENKVGAYLKEVAQQINNMTENAETGKWEENKTQPPRLSLPESIKEAANKKWKDKIEEAYEAELPKETELTEKDVTEAAEKSDIKWDNNPDFMAKSKELTGKEHLSEMNQEELGKMMEYVKEQSPAKEEISEAIELNPELPEGYVMPEKVEMAKEVNLPDKQKIIENEQPVIEASSEKIESVEPIKSSGEKELAIETTPPTEKPGTESGEGAIGITHAANEIRRQDRLLPEYEKSPQTFEQWNNEAEKAIKEGYDVEKLMDKIEKGHDPDPVENAIRKIYIATLDAEIAKEPTDALLAKQKRFIEIGDLANSRAGRNLASLKGENSPLSSISDFYVAKMEAAGVDKLTEIQKKETKEAFEKVQKADEHATAAMEAYREEIAKLKAENELLKQKKTPPKKGEKKDYAAERKEIIGDILLSFSKASGEGASFLGAKELTAMAGGVIKLAKNIAGEVGYNLKEVVGKIYEELKDKIKGLTEKDIHNILAGEYNTPRPTRSELAAKMRDLRDEAYYINKLDKLLKGEEPTNERKKVERNRQITELREKIKDVSGYEAEVKKAGEEMLSEKAKRAKATEKDLGKAEKEIDKADEKAQKEKEAADEKERKRLLAEAEKERKQFEREFAKEKRVEEKAALKAKLDEAKRIEKELSYRSPEEKALDAIIKRNQKQETEIREKIAKGDFETKKKISFLEDPEMQRKFPKQYNAALDAIVKREDARHEFDIALLKDQMARRGFAKKYVIDLAGDVLGTTRALVTGIDASGIGIQNLMAMVAHPRSAAKALPASFSDFVSAKNQERWLASVHSSTLFPLAKKFGLDITEPQSLKASEREEIFTHNLLDRPIRFKGKTYVISKYTTKPFERIFTGLGNRMRWNLWTRGVEKLYEDGFTPEKHPEEFESLAKVLNTETGRGTLHPSIKKGYDFWSSIIWSPRLMASRLNILGIGDLGNLAMGGKKGYYGGLTPRMREYAIKDFAKFVAFGSTMLALAGITFADDTDIDPNSATFGTFEANGKRYNIWGGFTQYVRLMTALSMGGENRQGKFKESNQLKTGLRFLWSKTTPAVSTGISLLNKDSKDYMGKPVTGGGAVESLLVPLSIRGIIKGVKNEGLGSIVWTGVPSFVGMNVSYQSDFDKQSQGNTITTKDPRLKADYERTKDDETKKDWFTAKGIVARIEHKGEEVEMTEKEKTTFKEDIEKERTKVVDEYFEKNGEYYNRMSDRSRKEKLEELQDKARENVVERFKDSHKGTIQEIENKKKKQSAESKKEREDRN